MTATPFTHGSRGTLRHDVKITLEVLEDTAGSGIATVIGTGKRMDLLSASLLNALMVRLTDRPVAVVKWVDGTVLYSVWQLEE